MRKYLDQVDPNSCITALRESLSQEMNANLGGTMKNGSARDDALTGFVQSSFGDTLIAEAARSRQLHDDRAAGDGVTPEGHTATRRLCAGVYLDREFRQRLLRDIYNHWKRRVAPSYGYDLAPVMRHAWRAWWLDLARDAFVIALFVAIVLIAPLSALLLVGLITMWHALRACWHVAVESTQMLPKRKSYDYVRGLRFRTKIVAWELLGAAVMIGGSVVAMRLSQQSWGLHDDLIQAGLLCTLLILLFAVTGVVRQRQLDRLHNSSEFRKNPRRHRLDALHRQQYHPVTIYSGYRPFVGSGLEAHRWSFAQRIIPKKEIGQEAGGEFFQSRPPFETSDIVRHLKESIERLASTEHSETRLPGLKVRDHIFIDGTYVCKIPDALDDPLPSAVLNDIMKNPREEARYHIACQVIAWDGELVTTVFVHISLQGQTLYVEFSTCALLPTPPHFRVIDEVDGTGPKATLKMARKGLFELPESLHSPRRLIAAPKHLIGALRAQRDTSTKITKRHDIGALISAREIAGNGIEGDKAELSTPHRLHYLNRLHHGHDETSYFQLLDVARHSKIIERRLLAGIEEFLKTKRVDTSEFVQRAEAILNYGMMNIGSNGTNIATGDFNTGYQPIHQHS